jgi:hypothetical protein
MRRLRFASILLFAALACAPLVATSCGGTAQEVGTETGNPPILDKLKLRLLVRTGSVEVIGDPGAVAPGGVEVTVRNLTSGEARTVASAADGSFSVVLRGGIEDGYEVTVSANGTNSSVSVDQDDGAPTCDAPLLLVQSCGQVSCHGAGSSFGAFAASESAPNDFVDAEPALLDAQCGLIIDSSDPLESLLLRKVEDRQGGACGGAMPLGTQGLNTPDVDCIKSWLLSLELP